MILLGLLYARKFEEDWRYRLRINKHYQFFCPQGFYILVGGRSNVSTMKHNMCKRKKLRIASEKTLNQDLEECGQRKVWSEEENFFVDTFFSFGYPQKIKNKGRRRFNAKVIYGIKSSIV